MLIFICRQDYVDVRLVTSFRTRHMLGSCTNCTVFCRLVTYLTNCTQYCGEAYFLGSYINCTAFCRLVVCLLKKCAYFTYSILPISSTVFCRLVAYFLGSCTKCTVLCKLEACLCTRRQTELYSGSSSQVQFSYKLHNIQLSAYELPILCTYKNNTYKLCNCNFYTVSQTLSAVWLEMTIHLKAHSSVLKNIASSSMWDNYNYRLGLSVDISLSRCTVRDPSPYIILHVHGGGFVSQTSQSHEDYLRYNTDSLT